MALLNPRGFGKATDVAFLLALRRYDLPPFTPEFRVCADRRWRFDYAWPQHLVALEVEGGLFGIGRPCPVCKRRWVAGHSSIERLTGDLEKYSEAAARGWRIIRVQPHDLCSDRTMDLIRRALAQ